MANPERAQIAPTPDRARLLARPPPLVVERTLTWLHQFKRLLVRYDRRREMPDAFLALGCCLVCLRRLERAF